MKHPIQNRETLPPIIQYTPENIHKIQTKKKKKTVPFIWITSRIELPGNNEAAQTATRKPIQRIQSPEQDFVQLMNKKIKETWNTECTQQQNDKLRDTLANRKII